jgi:metallophosphoesterase (TIGR03767 family)
MSAPRRHPRPLTRREFIQRAAAVSAVAASATLWTPARREALARTHGSVVSPEGTTLESFIWFEGTGGELTNPGGYGPDGYRRLTAYEPGWPIEVRTEFAEPKRGREDRREALAAFHHGTDYQFPDAQSPARVEFLARYADEPTPSFLSSAWRPQEALIVQATDALHRRLRELEVGPVTGRPIDFAMSTGDNYDNKQLNELEWFITLMNGGPITPNSGAGSEFEGVQNFEGEYYDDWYYHPDDDLELPLGAPERDHYKRNYGFPDYPGILEAAIETFTASGVGVPWYQTYGNHDSLVQGNERVNDLYADIVIGEEKVLHPADGIPSPGAFWRGLMNEDPEAVALYLSMPRREVTADENRRFIFDRDYVRAHLQSGGQPTGHGFSEWNLETIYLYYTFDIGPSVRAISLDTCAPMVANGAIGDAQMRWLEEQLIAVHSRYYEADGTEVRTGNDDKLVVVFGHHRFDGIDGAPGPRQVGGKDDEADAPDTYEGPDGYVYRQEDQHNGDALLELLHRFPNVIVYVNGHSHFNRVDPHPDPAGRHNGIWEITTSAILDPPQHGRIIELVDNRDGTLSLFGTLFDHAGPVRTDSYDDPLSIAGVSRELGFNDYQAEVEGKVGSAEDRNVELLLPAPFQLTPSPERRDEAGRRDGERRPAREQEAQAAPLPATGGGALAGLGASALVGAITLRERNPGHRNPGDRNPDETES